jgi:hypothetical protein
MIFAVQARDQQKADDARAGLIPILFFFSFFFFVIIVLFHAMSSIILTLHDAASRDESRLAAPYSRSSRDLFFACSFL